SRRSRFMRSPQEHMQLDVHIVIKIRLLELEYKLHLRTAICFLLGAVLSLSFAFPFDFGFSLSTLFLIASFASGAVALYWLNSAQEFKAAHRSLCDEYSRY
ncbi:hypothetical protein NPI23_003995, partial [Acinetobacter baumannii]